MCNNPYIVGKIEVASAFPFTGNLITKYFTVQRIYNAQKGKMENKITAFVCPAWVLMELLSFGDFIHFYDYYYGLKGGMPIDLSMINLVKSLRNGCAHNNCIIANLNSGSSTALAAIYPIIKTMPDINKNLRQKKLSCRAVLEFVSMLCVYDLRGNRLKVKGIEMFGGHVKDLSYDELTVGIMFELVDGVEASGSILVSKFNDINFLFCNHPLYPKQVDMDYETEYQEAGLNHSCALFSYEDMQKGKLSLYGEAISGLTITVDG